MSRLFWRSLPVSAVGVSLSLQPKTRLEYWKHDKRDFDVYVENPTAQDLPRLLHQFDKQGLEVWPWIWTHPNENGPHYVFIGVSKDTIAHIERLRRESEQNNILIIASQQDLDACADPDVYHRCQCGLVTDAKLQLLNHEAKILMLDDERVIAFDSLTIC